MESVLALMLAAGPQLSYDEYVQQRAIADRCRAAVEIVIKAVDTNTLNSKLADPQLLRCLQSIVPKDGSAPTPLPSTSVSSNLN
jgi:hypothetical protein